MIQFNLLPDVKLQFIKTQRKRRVVILLSIVVAGVSIAIMILLFVGVNVLQKQHLADLNKDVKKYSDQLKGNTDLNKVLTVQNQLQSLPALHADKPTASRLFGYMAQVTPAQADITKLDVDFDNHLMTINGTADALSTVNKFVDTLKFTSYSIGDTASATCKPVQDTGNSSDTTQKCYAFSDVVLSTFTKTSATTHYAITLTYDPTIFDITKTVTLSVPKIISTRSEVDKPKPLFNNQVSGQ